MTWCAYRFFLNEISSESIKTSSDTSSVDDVDTTPQDFVLPGLASTSISPKKRKS